MQTMWLRKELCPEGFEASSPITKVGCFTVKLQTQKRPINTDPSSWGEISRLGSIKPYLLKSVLIDPSANLL